MANLSSFDLNLLRVLDALLQDPSTTRAASRLGLSQPAVSAALGRLRAALGDELFFRRGQRLQPTDYALSLIEPLGETMAQIEVLLQGPAAFDPATASARFRVSGSDYFAELLMPQLARRLQDAAPGIRLHLVDLVPDNYIDTLETYSVDIALIPSMPLPDWLESRTVFHSGFLAVARTGHPRLERAGLAPGDEIPIDLFCDTGHVVFSPEGKERTLGDAALASVGRARRVVMSLPSFGGVYRAVAASDLIALLPTALARHVAEAAGLTLYRPPMPMPLAELVMIWHRRHAASPAHVWMRAQIADILSNLDERAD